MEKSSLTYNCFVMISDSALTDYDKFILRTAKDYLQKEANGISVDEMENTCSSVEWKTLQRERCQTKMEFYVFETVTEWIAYQLEWLLRIAISNTRMARLKLKKESLVSKIKHYSDILSGQEVASLVVGRNFVSVI